MQTNEKQVKETGTGEECVVRRNRKEGNNGNGNTGDPPFLRPTEGNRYRRGTKRQRK